MDVLIGIREKTEIHLEPNLSHEGEIKIYSVTHGLWFPIDWAMRLKATEG